MEAQTLVKEMRGLGFTVALGAGDKLLVSPSSKLDGRRRDILRARKTEVIAFLKGPELLIDADLAELIEVAMRVCDVWRDGPAARDEMRADCQALAPDLRADLLAHFVGTYGMAVTATPALGDALAAIRDPPGSVDASVVMAGDAEL